MDRAPAQQSTARRRIACRPGLPAALLLCSAVVAGCGSSEGGTAGVRLAARVNSEPITAQEVEAALKRNSSAALDASARRATVDELIEQRLAMQRAIEKGLDRAPQVVQAIEAARSEILARAHLEQIAGTHASPTPEDVRSYYAGHPELFAQRRVYTLEEIALARQPGIAAALEERAAMGQSFDEIAGWLESRAVRYAVNRGGRAAEQIPLELLPRLHAMQDGEVRVIEAGGGSLVVIRLLSSRLAPLDEAAAAPLIREFLRKRRSSDAVAAEMKRLRQRAAIEYVGELGARR